MKQISHNFELNSDFKPSGDQPLAIKKLIEQIKSNEKESILLGATGTGKTFVMSKVIESINKQTLIISHNKTLASQLYIEFKNFFPNNKVEYFISNFDYYIPEAYVPSTDTLILKESTINWELEMLRLSSINSLLTQKDTIVVASVAAIYALAKPQHYRELFLEFEVDQKINRNIFIMNLVKRGYKRNNVSADPGTFQVLGDVINISISWDNNKQVQVSFYGNEIESIKLVNPTKKTLISSLTSITLYPANMFGIDQTKRMKELTDQIQVELDERLKFFEKENKLVEHQRLSQRVKHDIEQLREVGYVSGSENYSRYFDEREPGQMPYSLFDYFDNDFLTFVDESHMTIPQFTAMAKADSSRKQNLVDYGFRLPSARDNRPLRFEEFFGKLKQIVYVSATPGDFELERVKPKPIELINRPTGLLDPMINVKNSTAQIDQIEDEIRRRIKNNERSLVMTITKRMAEELAEYFVKKNIKAAYLHSELKTFERNEVIRKLRVGVFDVIVGINLLREGIDIPEVSYIAIIDADKEGFLRNYRSLIQIIGRGSRNVNGQVDMFADRMTKSIELTIDETNRRREIQMEFNKKHNIIPTTIVKKIPEQLLSAGVQATLKKARRKSKDETHLLEDLTKQMNQASESWDFEKAAELRDIIMDLKGR